MTYGQPTLNDKLGDWGGEPSGLPQRTRTNYEGNFEAIWFWEVHPWHMASHTKDPNDAPDGQVGGATIVEFLPDGFRWTATEDMMEWEHDDPSVDEDGEPYYTEWGEDFRVETIEFGRKEILTFLRDYLSGRLELSEQERRHGFFRGRHWLDKAGTPAGRARMPRTREQLAAYIDSMGMTIVRSYGGSDDYAYELDIGDEDDDYKG